MKEFVLSQVDAAGVKSVLDIGCGKGRDLFRLGQLLPGAELLVGVDKSSQSVEEAHRLYGKDPRFRFLAADVSEGLPFDTEAFDAVLSCNLLECVTDKDLLLRETARVLKSHGQVVCAHWDWDTQVVDGEDKQLVRKVLQAYSDWQQPWMGACDGWMGRRLWRTFQKSGLFRGRVRAHTVTNTRFEEGSYSHLIISSFDALVRHGRITRSEYDRFMEQVTALAKEDQFFYSITMYVYKGWKAS